MYEAEAARLLAALHQRWGAEPGWELRANHDYGFYLMYRRSMAPLGEVRDLIVELFGFGNSPTVIIGDLAE